MRRLNNYLDNKGVLRWQKKVYQSKMDQDVEEGQTVGVVVVQQLSRQVEVEKNNA